MAIPADLRSAEPVRVGLMGCGAIAPAYLTNCQKHFAHLLEVVACADVVPETAAKCAAEFSIPRALTPADLLACPQIELIVNLTPAPAHAETNLAILNAGKHVFSEKPLALDRVSGRAILDLAARRDLVVGGAADTVLGAGLQAARTVVDSGALGRITGATGLITISLHGSRRYHEAYRGPVLDLGPYMVAA